MIVKTLITIEGKPISDEQKEQISNKICDQFLINEENE